MAGRFQGKIAVVTGAGSGMGRAIAVQFAAEGATVAALDLNKDTVAQTVASIRDAGGQASAFEVDLGNPASIKGATAAVLAQLGRIDILVNNAGVFDENADLMGTDEALWDKIFGVNLKATYLVTQAFMPALQATGAGAIVNIASIAGLHAHSGGLAYTASKHGVLGLTKSIAADYAPTVRCNAVLPGAIMTTMTRKLFEEGHKTHDAVLATPIARYAEPEEVARVALFLASEEASFMIGAQVVVDGGWSIV